MKTASVLKYIFILLLSGLFVTACSSNRSSSRSASRSATLKSSGKLPPGQAKKISGRKSAKVYAPGQRKKH